MWQRELADCRLAVGEHHDVTDETDVAIEAQGTQETLENSLRSFTCLMMLLRLASVITAS
jgi:hypothetical protein